MVKNCYEYICVYVDDLLVVIHNLKAFFKVLKDKYGYKLNGVGNTEYHLGGDFGQDPDGVLRLILTRCSRHMRGCLLVHLVRYTAVQ